LWLNAGDDARQKKAAHLAPLSATFYVVPANAETHAPRLLYLALGPDGFLTTIIGGYGSLLSQGRRKEKSGAPGAAC
jgi:hypothetical protein